MLFDSSQNQIIILQPIAEARVVCCFISGMSSPMYCGLCRDREKFDLASDADPVSDPRISDMKARKALDRLLPLLKSKDPSLDFWAVSYYSAEGTTHFNACLYECLQYLRVCNMAQTQYGIASHCHEGV